MELWNVIHYKICYKLKIQNTFILRSVTIKNIKTPALIRIGQRAFDFGSSDNILGGDNHKLDAGNENGKKITDKLLNTLQQ